APERGRGWGGRRSARPGGRRPPAGPDVVAAQGPRRGRRGRARRGTARDPRGVRAHRPGTGARARFVLAAGVPVRIARAQDDHAVPVPQPRGHPGAPRPRQPRGALGGRGVGRVDAVEPGRRPVLPPARAAAARREM
ncbi:MAG: hypothetical protein AVDCRST_MAG54-268, partial [uncultured Actinomycetospora sp.]